MLKYYLFLSFKTNGARIDFLAHRTGNGEQKSKFPPVFNARKTFWKFIEDRGLSEKENVTNKWQAGRGVKLFPGWIGKSLYLNSMENLEGWIFTIHVLFPCRFHP